MENDDKYRMLFDAAVDAWKFQIDSYWTRMSHFAVFELAFAAGLWKIFETQQHYFTSVGLAFGAIVLTIIWIVNNSRLHEYILYYWSRIGHFESLLALSPDDSIVLHFKKNRHHKRFPGEYHIYIQMIPMLFLAGWFWMFIWSICKLTHALGVR
jgi:hypothetical protein